jgi:2-furoate---CoA ligase
LPSLKRPKRVVVVAQVPKSAVGKILRRELVDGHYRALADSADRSDSPGVTPETARLLSR